MIIKAAYPPRPAADPSADRLPGRRPVLPRLHAALPALALAALLAPAPQAGATPIGASDETRREIAQAGALTSEAPAAATRPAPRNFDAVVDAAAPAEPADLSASVVIEDAAPAAPLDAAAPATPGPGADDPARHIPSSDHMARTITLDPTASGVLQTALAEAPQELRQRLARGADPIFIGAGLSGMVAGVRPTPPEAAAEDDAGGTTVADAAARIAGADAQRATLLVLAGLSLATLLWWFVAYKPEPKPKPLSSPRMAKIG